MMMIGTFSLPVLGVLAEMVQLVLGLLEEIRSGHKLNFILLTFQNQGSVRKSAFSTNAQSRFASVAVDGVGPAPLTVSLFLCSSGSNA